ncbi:MAG TPA: YceI family protein [Gemmatimonadales bacterium]|nr:YceI family protein [Gemmatimonadales bacterium]
MPSRPRWYEACLTACAAVTLSVVPPHHVRPYTLPMHWIIDAQSSLAWWQMNPHLGDLWGTTCPAESSWHAGRAQDPMKHEKAKTGYAGVIDTVVPLYPRPVAQAVCVPAVSGEIEAADTVSWRGVHGRIAVQVSALTSDLPTRDSYARRSLLQAATFPTVEFEVDSITGVARHGDTLTATAVGVFQLRGIRDPAAVPIRIWHDALGLRVTGQGQFPATELIYHYKMSRVGLGLGVASHVWKVLHWGLDAIFIPAPAGAN